MITVTRNSELMVAGVEVLDEGEEMDFVDSFTAEPMEVVDSGRIIIPESAIGDFVEQARKIGLEVEIVDQF